MMSKNSPADTPTAYRVGFILTTTAGNMTRYINLRKYAERDPEVECVWLLDLARIQPILCRLPICCAPGLLSCVRPIQ